MNGCFWSGCEGGSYSCAGAVVACDTIDIIDIIPNESAIEEDMVVEGRMYSNSDGTAKTASVITSRLDSTGGECDWSHWPLERIQEATRLPSREWNKEIAEHYRKVGLAEHASVASFSRVVLELMENAAPAWLLDRTMVAAREEIRHAQMAFALARSWSQEPFHLTGMDGLLAGQKSGGLVELARRTVTEACAGETPAFLRVAVAKHFVQDMQTSEYLNAVLVEEKLHASLAWATLAWAVSAAQGDEQSLVRLAVQQTLASTASSLWSQANASVPDLPSEPELLKAGILSPSMEAAVARAAAPVVEALGVDLLSTDLLLNGIDHFEHLVNERFDRALAEVEGLGRSEQLV